MDIGNTSDSCNGKQNSPDMFTPFVDISHVHTHMMQSAPPGDNDLYDFSVQQRDANSQ